jgi:hypothetical protein
MEASSMTAAESAARPRPLDFAWRAIRPDVPFHLLVGAFILAALVLHVALGYPRELDLNVSWELLAIRSLIYAVPAIVAALAWGMIRRGRSLRSARTWRDALGRFFEPSRTLAFVLVLFVLPPFMSVFTSFKASIPGVHPFRFDVAFMEIDRVLHLGQHPWVLLHGVLGSPPVTAFVDLTYSLWFAVVWLTVIWQVWHGSYFSGARSQFLLSLAACWIVIGVGFATLLSSAGPVYYGAVTGAMDPFAALVDYLHLVDASRPLKAVWIQNVLWENYVAPGANQFGEGISAMPSMHVSMAVIMALAGFRVNRAVGWAYTAFALLILVGSVHLAWHYAIDGYLAAALTVAVWWASGRVVRAWGRRGPQASEAS